LSSPLTLFKSQTSAMSMLAVPMMTVAAWAQEESQAGHAQLSRGHDSFYGPDSRRGLESCGVVHPDRREPSPNCAAGFQKLAMFGPTTGFLPK